MRRKRYFVLFFFALALVVFSAASPIFMPQKGVISTPSDDPVVPENEVPDEDMPIFKNAIDAWEYGINYMNNCKGYQYTSVTAAKAQITIGITVEQTQNIFAVKQFCDGKSLETTFSQCDLSVGENSYMYVFVEDGMVDYKYAPSKYYNKEKDYCDFSKGWSEKKSYEDYLKVCQFGNEDFVYGINKKTAKQVSFRVSKNKTYEYVISLDGDKLDPRYKQFMAVASGATRIDYDRMIVSVVMSSLTGRFLTINKQETYSMDARGFTLDVLQTTESTFNKFDEKFEIVNRYK
ncbi:MAG: hypothetical protein RR140_00210 [Clostridia bacterium]